MNEDKRIKQIGENSFLFFINNNKVFYFISFENIRMDDIRIQRLFHQEYMMIYYISFIFYSNFYTC